MNVVAPIAYIAVGFAVALFAGVAILRYLAADMTRYSRPHERAAKMREESTDPTSIALAVLAGIIGGAMWPATLLAIAVGYMIRALTASTYNAEAWTEEARRMDPERRAAYEAAWHDLDNMDQPR